MIAFPIDAERRRASSGASQLGHVTRVHALAGVGPNKPRLLVFGAAGDSSGAWVPTGHARASELGATRGLEGPVTDIITVAARALVAVPRPAPPLA